MGDFRLIILGAGDTTLRFIKSCMKNEEITLIGVVPDRSVSEEYLRDFSGELRRLGVEELPLNDESLSRADMVFSPEYRRIVPGSLLEKHLFVNCHGGILPKYRGFAANAWAIINHEKEIGYTIHRMNEKLDDGDIYFVKRIPIQPEQTYADVHDEMVDSIVQEVPGILTRIFKGEVRPQKQHGQRVYGTRFNASMGELQRFDVPAQYIVDLYRCMAKPLGTGVYFKYKDNVYQVNKIEHGASREVADYVAIPGKVVNIEDGELWVKTSDNVVILSGICTEDEKPIDVWKVFRNGCQLG